MENFFRNNIDAIFAKNQVLAKKISDLFPSLAAENMEIYKSDSGDYVLSYEGLSLDNMFNPKEAAALVYNDQAKNLSENDIIIVYGLASGYLLKHVCENAKCKIIFHEPSIEIFRFYIDNFDLGKVFADEKIFLATDEKNIISLLNVMYKNNESKIILLYPESYLHIAEDGINRLFDQINILLKD